MPKNRLAAFERKQPQITDPQGVRRLIALFFRFHGRCANRHCRRAQKCVGAEAPCFDAFWWDLPEIEKDLFREMVKARVAGATTPEEIERRAIEALMRYYKGAEKFAAPAKNAVQDAAPPREPILPRARIL